MSLSYSWCQDTFSKVASHWSCKDEEAPCGHRCQQGLYNHMPLTFGAIVVHIVRLHDLHAVCKAYCLDVSATQGKS